MVAVDRVSWGGPSLQQDSMTVSRGPRPEPPLCLGCGYEASGMSVGISWESLSHASGRQVVRVPR